MWFVSQTGSRTWSQVSCLGKHSYWLHPNLSNVVRQTCGLGMHLKNTNAAPWVNVVRDYRGAGRQWWGTAGWRESKRAIRNSPCAWGLTEKGEPSKHVKQATRRKTTGQAWEWAVLIGEPGESMRRRWSREDEGLPVRGSSRASLWCPRPCGAGGESGGPEGRSEGCSGWKRHDMRPPDRSGSGVGGVLINNRWSIFQGLNYQLD